MHSFNGIPGCFREMFGLCAYIRDSIVLDLANDILRAHAQDPPLASTDEQAGLLDQAYGHTMVYTRLDGLGDERAANIIRSLAMISVTRWPDERIGRLPDEPYRLLSECPRVSLVQSGRVPRIREFMLITAESVLGYLLDPSENPACPLCGAAGCRSPLDEAARDAPAPASNVLPFPPPPTGKPH
jgi:hypothetical protein